MARTGIKPFEISTLPYPWLGVLEREVSRLKTRKDVVAVGVCGSLAYGDIWPGSDLDIEVVVKGDKQKEIITTEQEVSVDYGYFGENQLKEIPSDTRPVHDPSGILTTELASRDRDGVIQEELDAQLDRARDCLVCADNALSEDPHSALAWTTSISMSLAEIFTLSAGVNRTHRRVVSRLEKATKKLQRNDILQSYIGILGFPVTLDRASELLNELQSGYREIWNYFKGKPDGPVYMVQQVDSEAWFKNRILPLYNYDRRDLVGLVYAEFRFVLAFVFKLAGYERTPDLVFRETAKLQGPPANWAERYKTILSYFSTEKVPGIVSSCKYLVREGRALANVRPWTESAQGRDDS